MENKITPFFWFDKNLKEIIKYYQDIFNRDGRVNFEEIDFNTISQTPSGTIEVAKVKLFGNIFQFMTAGPHFKFNEAISLIVSTIDQDETDYYWDAFTKEGEESQCGWCKDKYGLSWQITPKKLLELNTSKDKDVASYSVEQMLKMKKIIIKDLER